MGSVAPMGHHETEPLASSPRGSGGWDGASESPPAADGAPGGARRRLMDAHHLRSSDIEIEIAHGGDRLRPPSADGGDARCFPAPERGREDLDVFQVRGAVSAPLDLAHGDRSFTQPVPQPSSLLGAFFQSPAERGSSLPGARSLADAVRGPVRLDFDPNLLNMGDSTLSRERIFRQDPVAREALYRKEDFLIKMTHALHAYGMSTHLLETQMARVAKGIGVEGGEHVIWEVFL